MTVCIIPEITTARQPPSQGASTVRGVITPLHLGNHFAGAASGLGHYIAARRYLGFSNAGVASIRSLKNTDGHGFKLEHLPEEGRQYHAEVGYAPLEGVEFNTIHKGHLKVLLNGLFGKLVPWLKQK